MASQKKSKQQLSAPTKKDKKRKVSRASVIQSALNGRAKTNHNESHCPYQIDSEAADLWKVVLKTGRDPEAEFGTVVVQEKSTAE